MSNPDASSGEMHYSRQYTDEPDASLLDALLDGQPLPADATEQLRVVADMLASLVGPAGRGELAGEAAARVAFARASRRPRFSWLPARISARLAAGLVAAAIGAGGVAAAYGGVLPDPIQDLAHYLLHAPKRPADHRPDARPHAGKRDPATGKGNASHRPKANQHRKANHPRGRSHDKAKGYAQGKGAQRDSARDTRAVFQLRSRPEARGR